MAVYKRCRAIVVYCLTNRPQEILQKYPNFRTELIKLDWPAPLFMPSMKTLIRVMSCDTLIGNGVSLLFNSSPSKNNSFDYMHLQILCIFMTMKCYISLSCLILLLHFPQSCNLKLTHAKSSLVLPPKINQQM